jgi:hypothetical protein
MVNSAGDILDEAGQAPSDPDHKGGFLPPIDPVAFTIYPLGSKIEMGEMVTPDGPTPFISLASPGQPPSLMFHVDPISHQPMITLRMTPERSQSFPLDKLVASIPRMYSFPGT